jgi:hypothetical protein
MVNLGKGLPMTSPLAEFQGSLSFCVKIELTLLLFWKFIKIGTLVA